MKLQYRARHCLFSRNPKITKLPIYFKTRACSYGEKLSRLARKHFDDRNNLIILFCSYGETLSRLPGKVSDCDVALSKCTIEKLLTRQKVFSLSGKVGYMLCSYGKDIIPCTVGKLFVSYEYSVTFHITCIFITRRDLTCRLVEMFSR